MDTDVQCMCIVCCKTVSRRQEAVECDLCQRWQHRLCDTGLSQQVYKDAVGSGEGITYQCKECLTRENLGADPTGEDVHRNFPGPPILEKSIQLSGKEATGTPLYNEPPVLEISIDGDSTLNSSFDITDRKCEVASKIRNNSIPERPLTKTGLPKGEVSNEVVKKGTKQGGKKLVRSLTETMPPKRKVSNGLGKKGTKQGGKKLVGSLTETVLPKPDVSYEVVQNGTKRGGKKLVTSDGYSYTVKKTSKSTTYWICSIRNKNLRCPAAVCQNGDSFIATHRHVHQPDLGAAKRAKITAKIKTLAVQDVMRPAMEIVESTYINEVSCEDFDLFKPVTLKRIANRHRENCRPKEPGPQEIFFEINMEYLGEGFIRQEVVVDSHRHIICATDEQICLLRDSRRWFVDGTFKSVRLPFTQLWSIHTFIHEDGVMKQVPLVFILMTRRQTKDYVQVLEAIKTLATPLLQAVVIDFEQDAWIAFRDVFPGIQIHGCVFHWVHCIWRKVQNLGLQKKYMERKAVHSFIRKLMALPFLPHQDMCLAFENLKQMANWPPLVDLCRYLEETWFSSTVFTLDSVSVYKMGVRTKNDVEGWHRRINKKSNGCCLGFYTLVPLLKQEAAFVRSNLQLVHDNLYRRKYNQIQTKLNKLWDYYAEGAVSTVNLLAMMSKLYVWRVFLERERSH